MAIFSLRREDILIDYIFLANIARVGNLLWQKDYIILNLWILIVILLLKNQLYCLEDWRFCFW